MKYSFNFRAKGESYFRYQYTHSYDFSTVPTNPIKRHAPSSNSSDNLQPAAEDNAPSNGVSQGSVNLKPAPRVELSEIPYLKNRSIYRQQPRIKLLNGVSQESVDVHPAAEG
ncbi:hypothetical protein J6590_074939 [Homalodisca vitripennis]|nr:hypothetical protein J6590_074939 [Homalodisca vitripennis]